MGDESAFIKFCVKYKWALTIGGFLTLALGIGFIALPLGIIGFVKTPKVQTPQMEVLAHDKDYTENVGLFDVGTRMQMSQTIWNWKGRCPDCQGELGTKTCKQCGADIQKLAAKYVRQGKTTMAGVEIPRAVMKSSVQFLGGHKDVPNPVGGWLGILKDRLVFKNGLGNFFEIRFGDIKAIKIVSDNYTPGVGRAAVMALVGGNLDSQSFRPHNSALQVTYNSGTREKDLCFNFNALTWAGAVDGCQKFYAKLNAMVE